MKTLLARLRVVTLALLMILSTMSFVHGDDLKQFTLDSDMFDSPPESDVVVNYDSNDTRYGLRTSGLEIRLKAPNTQDFTVLSYNKDYTMPMNDTTIKLSKSLFTQDGNYEIQVSASGYQTFNEAITVGEPSPTRRLESIDAISSPTGKLKTEYTYGERLHIYVLQAVLNYSDGTKETVKFPSFGKHGITTSPANGEALTTVGPQRVKVTKDGISGYLDIVVSKKDFTTQEGDRLVATYERKPAYTILANPSDFGYQLRLDNLKVELKKGDGDFTTLQSPFGKPSQQEYKTEGGQNKIIIKAETLETTERTVVYTLRLSADSYNTKEFTFTYENETVNPPVDENGTTETSNQGASGKPETENNNQPNTANNNQPESGDNNQPPDGNKPNTGTNNANATNDNVRSNENGNDENAVVGNKIPESSGSEAINHSNQNEKEGKSLIKYAQNSPSPTLTSNESKAQTSAPNTSSTTNATSYLILLVASGLALAFAKKRATLK